MKNTINKSFNAIVTTLRRGQKEAVVAEKEDRHAKIFYLDYNCSIRHEGHGGGSRENGCC